MTVEYIINHAISPELETWLASQPDFVSIDIQPTSAKVYYDHASATEEDAFKALLAKQIGLAGENVNTSDTDLLTVNGVITDFIDETKDDYEPDGYDNTTTTLRISSDTQRSISGIVGGYEGRVLTIHNINNTDTIILVAEVGSAPENQFEIGSGVFITAGSSATLRYDADPSTEKWRLINGVVPIQSITNDQLTNQCVATDNIKDGDVTTDKIENQAVTEDKLDFDAVTEDIIADNAVTENKLDNGAVTTNKILDANVTGVKLATDTTWNLGTTTGVKIGTATSQKLGFYNATPVVQPSANADTSGATLGQLETEVNQLKQLLRDLGLLAP